MLWVAYVFSGIFAVACVVVLGRLAAHKHARPDWRTLDGRLAAVISGKTSGSKRR